MELNIIDLIKGQLGSSMVSQAASQLGESESGISKAITGLLPMVLGGLANNSDKPGVVDAITGAASSGILGNLVGGSSNNSLISGLLSSVFGDKIGGIVSAISSFSGISNSSSSSLLNMVTGATLGSVGKYATDNNLGASGITSLLGEQKGLLSGLLPAGLSLGALGLGNWFGNARDTVTSASSHVKESVSDTIKEVKSEIPSFSTSNQSDNNDGGGFYWKWIIPLLLLLGASYFLWKQCEKPKAEDAVATATTSESDSTHVDVATAEPTAGATAKTDGDIDLNGVVLKGYKGGMEESMISFLKSDGYKKAADDAALKDTWYTFDKVNFKIGKSDQLEEGSQVQMDNLVAILKAFPDAKIKIGGYTDKTGNEADNVKLSQARAEYIKAALAKAGVGAQVISAEGYGSKFATVDAKASNDERAVDRKMGIRFAK